MTLDEYQQQALKTASYPNVGSNLTYPTLGLAGEVGEIANRAKKIMRDDGGELTPERRESLLAEAGDCLWYCAVAAHELKTPLSTGWQHFDSIDSWLDGGGPYGDLYRLTLDLQLALSDFIEEVVHRRHEHRIFHVIEVLGEFIHKLGGTVEAVARANLAKLADRAERGVIHGAGDNR